MRAFWQRGRRQWLAAGALTLASACTGSVEPVLPAPSDDLLPGPSGAPAHGGAVDADGGQSGPIAQSLGRTGPRRLSNVEYDNTVRDLLGTKQTLAATFVSEEASGFDNVANALGMSPSQFESYYQAADTLVTELFADATRSKTVLPCNPGADDQGACLEQLLGAWGTRVFRRPLSSEEKSGLRKVYQAALVQMVTPPQARAQVLTAMLASPQFLYRVELDATGVPASRPLDGYELATRLSYFLWSTLPDTTLLELAASGQLVQTDVLRAQLLRMLADERAGTLVSNFASQWLGLRELAQHKVLATKYPDFDDALRASMIQEAQLFFRELLQSERPVTDFLSSSLHFVDDDLAALYGLSMRPGKTFQRIDTPIGERRGFLGLSAFLTLSSFSHRTSPTLRAKWVLEELLCSHVPPPPPNVAADLESSDSANAAATIDNVRARLELHRSSPSCAGCHRSLDPIGLGLEGFDAIGRVRTKYDNGDAIDTHGELPGGKAFDGAAALSEVLVKDPRFPTCVAEKLLVYALGRNVEDEESLLEETVATSGTPTLRTLIENIVLSDAFRAVLPSAP